MDIQREYDLVQLIGEGWFSRVYLAERRSTREEVRMMVALVMILVMVVVVVMVIEVVVVVVFRMFTMIVTLAPRWFSKQ